MLRTTMMVGRSITNGSTGVLSYLPNSVCVQCVRWRRKPRWLPMAKSKLFRIPERPKIPEDEYRELQRLNNNYKTQVRSLRRHIRETIAGKTVQEDAVARELQEKEDFERCLALNNEWNESVAKAREIRLGKEREARKEYILNKLVEKEKKEAERLLEIEKKVKQAKEDAVNFITAENIDQAIEDALANPVNHNWAIDEDGTVYHGKYVKAEAENSQKERRAQSN